jgi:prolyl 4-hydroxylase
MKFNKMTKSPKFMIIALVVIFAILCIFLFLTYRKRKHFQTEDENFDTDEESDIDHKYGYADIRDEYIEPVVHKNIINEEEANYILKMAKDNYAESNVLGGYNRDIRKSETAQLSKDDSVINSVISRVCKMTGYSVDHAEDLQVVKYQPNGFYHGHHDSCCDDSKECKKFLVGGGHRVRTMVIYLNEDFEGGATRFINLDKDVKPPKYSGVLFHTLDAKSEKCHPKALHAGLPIDSGEKYIANVWIHERPLVLFSGNE